MANVFNVKIENEMAVINVYLRGGILSTSSGANFIDGFLVKKGAGNVAATIQIGDYIDGWIGDTKVAGKSLINGTPTLVSEINTAQEDTIL